MEGPRLVRREEVEDLAQLLCDIFGFEQWYEKARFTRNMRRAVHLRGAMVIVEDGKPVSHILTIVDEVSINGCRTKAASLGGVCTREGYRNRGYAGLVLGESLARITAAGARILMVSGSRSLYRRNHCVPAGRLLAATIHRGSLPAPGEGKLTARRVSAGDWPLLAPLYGAEPVRFVRPLSFFDECCFWWDCASPEIWLIESAAKPLAYLCQVPDWSERERPARWVSEYAGCRGAIVEALPLILEQGRVEELHLRVLGDDTELAYLLEGRGLSLTPTTASGTHRLLNLPGLMRDLRPYLAARLPRAVLRQLTFEQRGDICRIALGDEQIEMDLSQGIGLVMGGPTAPQVRGELGRVLADIFPAPFPLPGFNYV